MTKEGCWEPKWLHASSVGRPISFNGLLRRRLFYMLRVLKHSIAIQPDVLWYALMGLMYCNELAFIFNKPLPERPIAKLDKACKSTQVDGITFCWEVFLILADTSIIHSSLPLRQMPIGFYRQVALDFPACFDFYGKFLGLTFIASFLPKFLNILLGHHRGPELCIQSWLAGLKPFFNPEK